MCTGSRAKTELAARTSCVVLWELGHVQGLFGQTQASLEELVMSGFPFYLLCPHPDIFHLPCDTVSSMASREPACFVMKVIFLHISLILILNEALLLPSEVSSHGNLQVLCHFCLIHSLSPWSCIMALRHFRSNKPSFCCLTQWETCREFPGWRMFTDKGRLQRLGLLSTLSVRRHPNRTTASRMKCLTKKGEYKKLFQRHPTNSKRNKVPFFFLRRKKYI